MRSGFIVVGICLLVSGGLAWQVKKMITTDLVAVQDLMLGLIYYMERHDAQFPPSAEAFLASDFVTRDDAGRLVITRPADSVYNEPHGYPIEDLAQFEIRWGSDLSDLKVDERGTVSDGAGQKVTLIKWPGSPPSGKTYSAILVRTHQDMLGRMSDPTAAAHAGP